MDNFLLHAITNELESTLVGQRLGKVFQTGATGLALDFHLRDGRWLVISTDPLQLALYLSTRSPRHLADEPRSDTSFVALVRKYLSGARLKTIEKLGYDRVVNFLFTAEDEAGQLKDRTLVVWLTGRAANVFLLEDTQILGRLRGRDEPTTDYLEPPPPSDKHDPFDCSAKKLDSLIAAENGSLANAAQNHLIGFSSLYARELEHRAGRSTPDQALRELLASMFESAPTPVIYSLPSLDELRLDIGRLQSELWLSPIELRHLASYGKATFSNVNAAADMYYSLLDERRRLIALKQKLNSHLTAKLKKQRNLLANLKREREGFARTENYQRYGELLLANLHQVVKAGEGFVVTDFYDELQRQIEIPAVDKGTAREAAEHYFKLARKAKHGLETINSRLPQIETEVAQIEGMIERLVQMTSMTDLTALAEEAGLAVDRRPPEEKSPRTSKKAKAEKIAGVRRYRSSDGYQILVGRTDRDNDNLTFRIAKSFDLWFHAADYPGSHVVLRNPKRQGVPPRTITEAAQLAAKFSQAGGGAKVAVNYCEKKFVTKQKGFAPGQVRLSSFKTVLVEPDEAGERIL